MGRKITEGEDVCLDELIGRQAILVIVEEIKGDNAYSKIAGLKPYKKQDPMSAPAGAGVDDEDKDPFEEE